MIKGFFVAASLLALSLGAVAPAAAFDHHEGHDKAGHAKTAPKATKAKAHGVKAAHGKAAPKTAKAKAHGEGAHPAGHGDSHTKSEHH